MQDSMLMSLVPSSEHMLLSIGLVWEVGSIPGVFQARRGWKVAACSQNRSMALFAFALFIFFYSLMFLLALSFFVKLTKQLCDASNFR